MAPSAVGDDPAIPVILLKTKSPAGDAYEDLFSAPPLQDDDRESSRRRFAPRFVPVLQHRFEEAGLAQVRALLRAGHINARPDAPFGGLVFTSQRAVEAFTQLVEEGQGEDPGWPHLGGVPVYSVGPATTRALRAVPQTPALEPLGSHTGNGDALARFILDRHPAARDGTRTRPPLLFLVGEQRRDVIPRTLSDPALAPERRIRVDEVVVYGTGVMESFRGDFGGVLAETGAAATRWVVVFSPTGCDGMLRALGLLDEETGRAGGGRRGGTFVATIGPTTRDYLVRTFGFEPDVCAETPSPEGVRQGILDFESKRSQN